jgi:hypothetical protein
VLLREGFIEKPFSVRIGNGLIGSTAGGSHLQVVNILGNTNNPTALNGGAYNLDGANPANDISGALLVEAVIEGVDPQDAKDFNDRIDGASLGAALGSDDLLGRVKYAVSTNSTCSVRVYIAHK